ncbi:MAG: hypothetical protein ABS81_08030 [Pseudonocardia sp. SCN 72-86]|nr:MAG: hypothetical protein ABS81_08030 [Pseudonocardia sp. SCN 72-86]
MATPPAPSLLDTRPIDEYSRAHIPGSLAIPPGPGFSARLRCLATPDVPAVVVGGAGHDVVDLVWRSLTVGFESIIGELDGGVEAWFAAGLPVIRTQLVPAQRVDGDSRVLDVRAKAEFVAGHIPDAVHVELASVRRAAPALNPRPAVVMCVDGVRAASAVGLLERAGHFDVAILASGPGEWARATGRSLAYGRTAAHASFPAQRCTRRPRR